MFHLLRRACLIKSPLTVIAYGFSGSSVKLCVRFISSSSKEHPFAVSYLINKIEFSPESALLASKYLNFKTHENADSVLEFFHDHGFSKPQISKLVKKFPRILSSNPEKTLLPKLLFRQSKGLSSFEIANLLSAFPAIFIRSLNRQIVPAFDYIQGLLQSEERTVAAIKRYLGLLTWDPQMYARPNVEILKENGVPASNIAAILQYQPRVFLITSCRFRGIVEEVKEMGFNPLRMKFVLAVFALRTMRKLTWKRKVDVYKKWGWSEDEVILAFGRHPWCMMASEMKINSAMDFFINKLGCESSYIAKRPALISLSLKRRIIPRASVYQVLLSKGLIKKNANNLPVLFNSSEKVFLDKFIYPYEKLISELMKLYKDKLEVSME